MLDLPVYVVKGKSIFLQKIDIFLKFFFPLLWTIANTIPPV